MVSCFVAINVQLVEMLGVILGEFVLYSGISVLFSCILFFPISSKVMHSMA